MAHNLMEDDANIIKKCHDYGFCCTYDAESKFRHESVKDAIAAVLASRSSQSEKLGRLIAGTDKVMGPLQELVHGAKELAKFSAHGAGAENDCQDVIGTYQEQLAKEMDCLAENLSTLEGAKRVMDRRYIRVPVVGVINSGKSTFLHSALGGGMSDTMKENLFPSAGGHQSCTGTRTVLIYDNDLEGLMVLAKFKDKLTFVNDCRQSIRRMINVLERLNLSGQYPEIYELQDNIAEGANVISLLGGYCQSAEFKALCKIQYKDARDAESVWDFCSFVHFSKNQDYTEDEMARGTQKNYFNLGDLTKSWKEGTDYGVQISSEREFELVKNFVCKYDPNIKEGTNHYTTYCGVQVVEIRGNLCGEIAGLELIDSVGANDDAISNEEQMKTLMQDSDAMILLERPQSLARGGWSIGECVQFVREQKKASDQFLYLVYNCYKNNTTTPSDLSLDIDSAKKYYSGDCKRVYVSDIGEWEEVQSKMLVDMLVNLSESVEETHKEYLSLAEKANSNISGSIQTIRQIAGSLGQICIAEDENASERKEFIEKILQRLFGEVEKLAFDTKNETKTPCRVRVNEITQNLVENLRLDAKTIDFNTSYEYVSPTGPRFVYNRYVAFLCMYSHMLEDAKRQYNILRTDINAYVANKRQELLKILWESGRFQCIMSDPDAKGSVGSPDAGKICSWLRKNARELLADVLEDLLLKDIGAESLIDGSIGKVIEQFEPKNLTLEQLFGQQISDPGLENDESAKAAVIVKQLSIKADELRNALLENVIRSVDGTPEPDRSAARKKEDSDWDKILNNNTAVVGKTSDWKPEQNLPTFGADADLFDLDQRIRKDVVCDGILKKFRDKLRGEGLPQNAEQPINQLYNLYYHYYDVLLSEEELSYKKRLGELRRNTDMLARQLIVLCQKWN